MICNNWYSPISSICDIQWYASNPLFRVPVYMLKPIAERNYLWCIFGSTWCTCALIYCVRSENIVRISYKTTHMNTVQLTQSANYSQEIFKEQLLSTFRKNKHIEWQSTCHVHAVLRWPKKMTSQEESCLSCEIWRQPIPVKTRMIPVNDEAHI